METENKDWKPEVGKTAWFVGFDSVYEILITDVLWEESQNPWYKGTIWFHPLTSEYNAEIGTWDIFPTSEAALASIKIYDLEGKEVVIPRAQDKIIDEMCARAADSIFNLSEWDDTDYAELGMAPIINGFKEIIAVKDKAVIKRLIDVAHKMDLPPNPEGEARLKAAQERFKSAIGGKSDQREGGC